MAEPAGARRAETRVLSVMRGRRLRSLQLAGALAVVG
jgi:hypothetical protein